MQGVCRGGGGGKVNIYIKTDWREWGMFLYGGVYFHLFIKQIFIADKALLFRQFFFIKVVFYKGKTDLKINENKENKSYK